ncbi:BA75_03647T0 [Komagataella pastoris]|uniref:BA75_03647T0 n=1 Tax=Komagataella pastoris TaxID=4922 RepID=A0A1B2JG75_PICPA|nr:BA75_03647T0 [Komagataella pastoris]
MGLFSKKDKAEKTNVGQVPKVHVTKDDTDRLKYRSNNIHDPILMAVNEAQPFEQSTDYSHARQQSFSNKSGDGEYIHDIFGQPISNPDVSNPARSRDERPLDTIRSFEYAITGDTTYKQLLETPTLGWRVRPDFPGYESGRNYQYHDTTRPRPPIAGQNPVISFSGDQNTFEQDVNSPTGSGKGKKKRGLFGRKKE